MDGEVGEEGAICSADSPRSPTARAQDLQRDLAEYTKNRLIQFLTQLQEALRGDIMRSRPNGLFPAPGNLKANDYSTTYHGAYRGRSDNYHGKI